MIKILFVCLANICRSPMAEFIMKDMVKKEGLQDKFFICSAATCNEKIGSQICSPARKILDEHNISYMGKFARQMVKQDYEDFDLIIGMDINNVKNIRRIAGGDKKGKVHLLMSFTDEGSRNVADPWRTGNIEEAWNDCYKGCRGLLDHLKKDL